MAKDCPVEVVVDVTIEDHKITNIDIIKHRNWKGGAAEKTIPDRIIRHQSTKVDAVSGVTVKHKK